MLIERNMLYCNAGPKTKFCRERKQHKPRACRKECSLWSFCGLDYERPNASLVTGKVLLLAFEIQQ